MSDFGSPKERSGGIPLPQPPKVCDHELLRRNRFKKNNRPEPTGTSAIHVAAVFQPA